MFRARSLGDMVQDCNIFGGKDACKAIPSDSKFANECKSYRPDLMVDCVYFDSSEGSLNSHPRDTLQHYLQDAYTSVAQHCPECFISLTALVRTRLFRCLPKVGCETASTDVSD
jgi:hypothetical protein